ncbi:OLC1v1014975C1 [Oldenlandia corymbosa var. corymbosa]|uniref:ABC-type xenobiotic transporter n=1 Tax=Oldenlandia corymbosa var. corymbosa TaxID=529605 RepID=A0AAV1E284_OLDCO|nr:OLC1v1014975C1 [Oldenlandia corymbosa var. corymbosa]
MVVPQSLLRGLFCSICEGKFETNFKSPCFQRILLDALNVFLAFVFFLVLLFVYVTKRTDLRLQLKNGLTTTSITIFCLLLSFAYFGFSSLNLNGEEDRMNHFIWLPYLLRGLIWAALSLTLLVQGSRGIKLVISAWWVEFFVLITAFNIEVLLERHSIEAIEFISWLGNILLLFCAMSTLQITIYRPTTENAALLEPLLTEDPHKGHTSINLGQVSFFSKLTLSWVKPLLHLGNSKTLAIEDIPCLGSEDEAGLAYKKFDQAWKSLQGKTDFRTAHNLVLCAITRVYWKEMVLAGTCAFLRAVAVAIAPLFLFGLVRYYNSETRSIRDGAVLLVSLVLLKVVESLSSRHFYFYARRLGMRMRSALIVAVYQKQLKLSSKGRRVHSAGEVVNYIAVDAYRMGEFPMWTHIGWSSVLQLLLAIAVLFAVVGLGALPGLLPLIMCGFLNVPFAKLIQKCQREFMIAQDKRLRIMSEILNNMKIIKLQSWEDKFKNLIESYRENEFKWLAESQYKKVYITLLFWMSPTIVSSVIFFGCIVFRSAQLNASTVFTVLASLRSLSEPVRLIPEALSALMQVNISFDRINSFLQEDEIKDHEDESRSHSNDLNLTIQIEDGCFSWHPDSATLTIHNVNLHVQRGQKVAVCGPVGAGKSSLLNAILGEIHKTSGNLSVHGDIAYVSQASWIQSGTIRENILFGEPMNNSKYEEALRVSALEKDIDSFEYGDLTEIGQRGINMSGGQKQRIQLARAVYRDADIYLLDDPFSAVDAHTGATLFNDCVMSALANKTVILATHQIEFLSAVDHILVMEGGHVTQSGSYKELLTAGTVFEELVVAHQNAITFSTPLTRNEDETQQDIINKLEDTNRSYLSEEKNGEEISMIPAVEQLTKEEEKEIEDVGFKTFLDYVRVSNAQFLVLFIVISAVGFFGLQAVASYWLAFSIQSPSYSNFTIVSVYALIATLSALFIYLRSLFAAIFGLRASKAFFSGFTSSIFNAPMLFFDSTPVGRILTRASSDFSVLDFDIPFPFASVLVAGIEIIATICIMASITWQVFVVGAIATIASKYVQGYYQSTAQELMRINGTTKAPITNYASETALGVATIRAFRMSNRFFQNYLKLVDTDAKAFLFSNAAMEWFILRVETLQNLTLFTAAFLLISNPKQFVAPGLVGLSLSYAFTLPAVQIFFSRWYSNLVNYYISVERIKQFMHIPPEPPAIVEDSRPPPSWPSHGRIELLELNIRYRPNTPLVLKGITCTFREGTRTGVVGRTGSGKTTLVSALFRLVEPYSGQIIVDGINICSVGLKDLRSKLSIIPQEPTLFRGSIRTNLDPFGLYTDEEIWQALEKCQLKDTVSSLPNLLDSSVSDEGENWSMGQRQLFCLGRVLLKRNRILVLDEATASIDSATDAILQKVIREEFSKSTVITVAHRVPTVIDSDMVMVLSLGKFFVFLPASCYN